MELVGLFGLHCLSAFSAFPTHAAVHVQFRGRESPLPFGVQCVPDNDQEGREYRDMIKSPLPFGVQCVPDAANPSDARQPRRVSIAFRRSVRSRLG